VLTLIDLDPKPIDRLVKWARMDRDIALTFAQHLNTDHEINLPSYSTAAKSFPRKAQTAVAPLFQ
jgi:hypothetical protein